MTSHGGKTTQRHAGEEVSTGLLSRVVPGCAVALLTARFLIPTEGSVDGDTVWLTLAWLGLAVVWIWERYHSTSPLLVRDGLTLAVLLLVAGHVVSASGVFWRGGDRRAALNMLWEWAALGVSFVIVRSYLARPGWGGSLLRALTAVAVALAGLGLYQHYIGTPQLRRQYEDQQKELLTLLERGRTGTNAAVLKRQKRVLELRRRLESQGIPLEASSRQLWERRLYSDEPFGPFALANTFAGLLALFLFPAVALFVATLGAFRAGNQSQRSTILQRSIDLLPLLFAPLILWCLLLTKSRTAWVGAVAGIAAWWLFRGSGTHRKRWARRLVIVFAAVLVVVVAIAFTGGLDSAVLSEAPKSWRYRLEYWTGSIDVVRESPLLGTGPGNFRQHYLKYKLPQSSEEIRDPHNLFLDVWCSGGLLALLGLIGLLGCTAKAIFKNRASEEETSPQKRRGGCGTGMFIGIASTAAVSWFYDDGNTLRLLSILAGSGLALIVMGRWPRSKLESTAVLAAFIAMIVHLLGAGGIEMPAIAQLVLVLSAGLVGPVPDEFAASKTEAKTPKRTVAAGTTRLAAFAATMIIAVTFWGSLFTTALPVTKRKYLTAEARYALSRGFANKADDYLEQAAIEDSFSPQPLRELANFAYARWQQSQENDAWLQRAIKWQRLAISLDANHFGGYWNLARFQANLYDVSGNVDARDNSLQNFAEAVLRYPNNPQLLAEYAEALSCGGKRSTAVEVAERALERDGLNREAGHRDRYLSDIYRKLCENIRAGRPIPCHRESPNR